MRTSDTELLVGAVAAGTTDAAWAFGRLVHLFQDMVFGLAYSQLCDYHAAQDASQDAFVTAYLRIGELRDPAAFGGWLRQIVLNRCRELARNRKTGRLPLEAAAGLPSQAESVELQMLQSEQRRVVSEAIGNLSDAQRYVVILYYLGQWSVAEVSQFLDILVTATKKRLVASRAKLKEN